MGGNGSLDGHGALEGATGRGEGQREAPVLGRW